MLKKLRDYAKTVKMEILVYKAVLMDSRTPFFAKMLLAMAIGYALLPFDFIPDFIPILGYLDDVIIVSLFVIVALKITDNEIVEFHRKRLSDECKVPVKTSI